MSSCVFGLVTFRILYEVFDADRVVLIYGIVDRKELEQWLRQKG
jgi:hypothetical protein